MSFFDFWITCAALVVVFVAGALIMTISVWSVVGVVVTSLTITPWFLHWCNKRDNSGI